MWCQQMKTTEPISIQHESGKEVKGVISFRSEADIVVEITSPYTGLTGGRHIPYFSRPHNSFMTDYGNTTAKSILSHLYDLSRYMEDNLKFLKLQSALHFYNSDYSDYECQKRFFDSSFPLPVPEGTRNCILEILK
jgi:hypothetical protein